jgi:hypothetical protein
MALQIVAIIGIVLLACGYISEHLKRVEAEDKLRIHKLETER